MATAPIVSLEETKEFLNIPATTTTSDDELERFIAAASAMWIRRIGQPSTATFTETHDGGRSTIILDHSPVQSVASVVESQGGGVSHTLSQVTLATSESFGPWDYTLDASTGVLTRRASGSAIPFASGSGNISVTYTSGYESVPEDIEHAILLLVLHLWQTQRGGQAGRQSADEWNPAFAFTWPSRVEEIAATYIIPGIA